MRSRPVTSATSGRPLPLAGIRVLDLSRALSGPFAGRILGDLGADVVKVEMPGTDIAHGFGKTELPHSGLYTQLNAGKRNLSFDLFTPAGRDLALQLAEACDVVIENFRPGTLDRVNLGWEDLSTANPGLVMLSISGFGQTGPEAGRRAYAPVIHAEAGLLGRQAEADDREPAASGWFAGRGRRVRAYGEVRRSRRGDPGRRSRDAAHGSSYGH